MVPLFPTPEPDRFSFAGAVTAPTEREAARKARTFCSNLGTEVDSGEWKPRKDNTATALL